MTWPPPDRDDDFKVATIIDGPSAIAIIAILIIQIVGAALIYLTIRWLS